MGLENSSTVLPLATAMILVVGPGRCGTSAIAGFLHKLGVHMTPDPEAKDSSNPTGFFEDSDFQPLNITLSHNRITPRRFIVGIKEVIKQRKEPWGLKHPVIAHFLPFYLPLLDDVKFIRLHRDKEEIIASMQRQYRWNRKRCENCVDRREKMLDYFLQDYLVLDVDFYAIRDIDTLQRIADFAGLPLNDEALDHIRTPEEMERIREELSIPA
jgi:hypothetical protein